MSSSNLCIGSPITQKPATGNKAVREEVAREENKNPDGKPIRTTDKVPGPVIHKDFQGFLNRKHFYPSPFRAVWTFVPLLELGSAFSDRLGMLSRGVFGTSWAAAYSAFRPWADGRDTLADEGAPKPIGEGIKTAYKANEHFRAGMGSLVTAVYGGGAVGMLVNALKGDEDGFNKARDIYTTGMFNQNQIFASMNLSTIMKRAFNPKQLMLPDRETGNVKSTMELVDALCFPITFLTRSIDSVGKLGVGIGETTQKVCNVFSYLQYGTWAARFGYVKQIEHEKFGALEPKRNDLTGFAKQIDDFAYNSQKYGAKAFWTTLPVISWAAALAEGTGNGELAQTIFKWEGILERLNPVYFGWNLRDTWINWFCGKPPAAQEVTATEQRKEEAATGNITSLSVPRTTIRAVQTEESKAQEILKRIKSLGKIVRFEEVTSIVDELSKLDPGDTATTQCWDEFVSKVQDGKTRIPINSLIFNRYEIPLETLKKLTDSCIKYSYNPNHYAFLERLGKGELNENDKDYWKRFTGELAPMVSFAEMGHPIAGATKEKLFEAINSGKLSWGHLFNSTRIGSFDPKILLEYAEKGSAPLAHALYSLDWAQRSQQKRIELTPPKGKPRVEEQVRCFAAIVETIKEKYTSGLLKEVHKLLKNNNSSASWTQAFEAAYLGHIPWSDILNVADKVPLSDVKEDRSSFMGVGQLIPDPIKEQLLKLKAESMVFPPDIEQLLTSSEALKPELAEVLGNNYENILLVAGQRTNPTISLDTIIQSPHISVINIFANAKILNGADLDYITKHKHTFLNKPEENLGELLSNNNGKLNDLDTERVFLAYKYKANQVNETKLIDAVEKGRLDYRLAIQYANLFGEGNLVEKLLLLAA